MSNYQSKSTTTLYIVYIYIYTHFNKHFCNISKREPGALVPNSLFHWWRVFYVTVALSPGSVGKTFVLQKPIKAAAAIFKHDFLFPTKQLGANWFEHLRLHQSLAEPSGFESRHLTCAKHHILHQIAEHGVHRIWASETASVDSKMSSASAHLYLSPEGLDDVIPQLGGTKGARETYWVIRNQIENSVTLCTQLNVFLFQRAKEL